jgi:DNA-binding transcriptional LysR family regulator
LAAPHGFDATTSERDFAVHITDLGEAFFLPRLLARLNAIAPRVRLRTLALSTDEARDALRNGAADLTIGNLPDFAAGFYQQRLFRDRYVCIVSRDHPTIGTRLTARQFAAASHAIAMPGGTGHGIIERTLVAHGLESRIALRVQNFLVLPSIVAASDLIAIVPHSVGSQISPQDAVKLLALPVDIPAFDVRQCWHERYHDDPGHRWLRQQFMELFGEQPSESRC